MAKRAHSRASQDSEPRSAASDQPKCAYDDLRYGSCQDDIPRPEVFISYARADEAPCQAIAQALAAVGATVWVDKKSIRPGHSWVGAIFRGLDRADYVLVLLSPNSIASRWVEKEYETALANSLSGKTSQRIIPILLEQVNIPSALQTIQCIDLTTDTQAGIQSLVDRICTGPMEQGLALPSRDPTSLHPNTHSATGVLCTLQKLARCLLSLVRRRPYPAGPSVLPSQLLGLHRSLLRLEAIVEELAKHKVDESEHLWALAGDLMRGPIPGSARVLSQIDAELEAIDRAAPSLTPTRPPTPVRTRRLSLLKRYITVMQDVTLAFRDSFVLLFHLQAPEIAQGLTQLWRSKIDLNRALSRMKHGKLRTLADCILADDEYFAYIEASRTLEARVILQVIDADARAVAHDPELGITVFGELAADADTVKRTVLSVRRNLGRFINANWPETALGGA